MKKAIFPGTFNPPTLGHLNIIHRAAEIFDYLYIAVGNNREKDHKSGFSAEERADLLRISTQMIPKVEVVIFDGLLVDYAKTLDVNVIVRALRNSSDFDYECLQAQMNRQLSGIETLYMVADEKFRFISSTLIREIANYGKELTAFVPAEIKETVLKRFCNQ